jgi:hypothetical protein
LLCLVEIGSKIDTEKTRRFLRGGKELCPLSLEKLVFSRPNCGLEFPFQIGVGEN